MAVTTLRPNGFAGMSGIAVTGAASPNAALADDSNSSYIVVQYNSGASQLLLTMPAPSLPAGAVPKSYSVQFKWAQTNGTAVSNVWLLVVESPSTVLASNAPAINLNQVTTYTVIGGNLAAGVDPDDLTIYLLGAYDGVAAQGPNTIRLYELYLNLVYVEQPDLSVTAPSGTVTDTNIVAAAWTPDLDTDGGAQTHFEVAVTADGDDPDSDPRLVESGIVASSVASWQAVTPLADGNYDVHVRLAQTVNGQQHWSDWAKGDFEIDVNRPGVPSLAAVPEDSIGGIWLPLDDNGGAASADIFQVQWFRSDGISPPTPWTNVRTPLGGGLVTVDQIPGGNDAFNLYDFESPNGVDTTYRARSGHVYSAGNIAWSNWTADVTAQWSSRQCWLKHPLDPGQNRKVTIDAYGEYGRQPRHGQMQPLGRSTVIIAADKRGPKTGSVTFYVPTYFDRVALEALLDANPATPLLLQTGAADKRPDRWVIFGQHDTAFVVDKSWVDDTRETLGWIEVPRP